MSDFAELDVVRKTHKLTLDVYRLTSCFPGDERYGLTSQIRRACVSIGANVVEGTGRDSKKDFRRFVGIARGSASELEYLLTIARDLEMADLETAQSLLDSTREVARMLSGLRRALASG